MISPARGAFLTHSNYIQAIDRLVGAHYVPPRGRFMLFRDPNQVQEAIANSVRSSALYNRLSPRPQADTEAVVGIVRNAWSAEFLLASTGELASDEIIGTANNWAVVQAYYAIYHAGQALLFARGDTRAHRHETGQSQFAAFWTRPSVALPPWSLGWHSTGLLNLPPGRTLANIKSPWIGCDDDTCWELVAMALRTTREDALKEQLRSARERKRAEAKKVWQRDEEARLSQGRRPRKEPSFGLPVLSAEEKRDIDRHLRRFTLLDYLYRLRIRSNYQDTTMFEDGPEQVIDSRVVHDCLRRITSSTLLVHELLIARLIGTESLRNAVDQWTGASAMTMGKLGVNARRHLILR